MLIRCSFHDDKTRCNWDMPEEMEKGSIFSLSFSCNQTRVIITVLSRDKNRKKENLWITFRGQGNVKIKEKQTNSYELLQERTTWWDNDGKRFKPAIVPLTTNNFYFVFNPVHFCLSLLLCDDIYSLCEPVETQKHDETYTNENMGIYVSYENICILNCIHQTWCNLNYEKLAWGDDSTLCSSSSG